MVMCRCRSRQASSGRSSRSCFCTRTAHSPASGSSTPSGARTFRTRLRRWCRSTSRSCGRRFPNHGCTPARPGYVLEVGDDELDLARFERAVADARHALSQGDPGKARELLGEALALWRGPALAEFSEPFARHEGARLEELRLAALEWRIEADLALGHHRDVVGELEALIAEHPLRERVRSQHMLALYRSGRHADGLASYQAFRRTLADELGIEPSASLRELQRRMLQQDPTLELPPSSETGAVTSARRTIGRFVPARPGHGDGRLRPQRRRPDRLPDRRRRAGRPRSRPRLGLHLPARLGEPEAGRLLPAARVDGAAHPL